MKKLFTLFALMACFLGAKAEVVEDYTIDYSSSTAFPFYVMGYVPEWVDGVMTDYGAMYNYVTLDNADGLTSDYIVSTASGAQYYRIPLESPGWHQYFIADNIPTEVGRTYTVKAMVRASEACTINVNMGWGWGEGQQVGSSVSIGTEWAEVEWETGEIGGSNSNLVAQPGTVTAVIEWKWVKVSHDQKNVRPVEWIELLQNGDAEKSWAELGLADVAYNDMDNNYKVCAWGKERGENLDDTGAWNPFPATIETEAGTSNHVFVVHGKEATTEGDAAAWDNQFWIQSPQEMKAGTQVKLKFRYKASKAVTVDTQTHYQMPSNYLIWHCAGSISFTEEWQEYDQTVTFADDMGGGWSCAFQLNQNDHDAIDFYFDDLSWSVMKLDEGYFVASSNTTTGLAYDFDTAPEFTLVDDDLYEATVGTKGKQDTWVNEVMISTVRGYDASFKGATLKPSGSITMDPEMWYDYTASSNYKIKLPAAGVWTILIDTDAKQMNFVQVEGEAAKQPIEINPNPYVVVVNGVERDDLSDGTNQDGSPNIRENEGGTGETWDNQFFIKANRALSAGEETVISFKYKGSRDAKTTTQCHGEPGAYIHWSAIGDVNFTTEEQTFEADFIIPNEADGMQSIAFNMAEIREACDYTIWDVVWKLKDNTESLINQTGGENFFIKVGAGTNPEVADGIEEVVANGTVQGNGAIYNIAGQRVDNSYKGVVIKNGKKYIAK